LLMDFFTRVEAVERGGVEAVERGGRPPVTQSRDAEPERRVADRRQAREVTPLDEAA
jgi:hypothetical protein